MKTTFDLSGYTLIIGGQYQETQPSACSSPVDLSKVVPLQLIHHPLPKVSKTCFVCKTEWNAGGHDIATPDDCPKCGNRAPVLGCAPQPDMTVFWATLEPSHARAIASAILACATQAQRQ